VISSYNTINKYTPGLFISIKIAPAINQPSKIGLIGEQNAAKQAI